LGVANPGNVYNPVVTKYNDVCTWEYTHTFKGTGLSPNGTIFDRYEFSFSIVDGAGNVTQPSSIVPVYNDKENPIIPSVLDSRDSNGTVREFKSNSAITKDTSLLSTFSGEKRSDVVLNQFRTVNTKSREQTELGLYKDDTSIRSDVKFVSHWSGVNSTIAQSNATTNPVKEVVSFLQPYTSTTPPLTPKTLVLSNNDDGVSRVRMPLGLISRDDGGTTGGNSGSAVVGSCTAVSNTPVANRKIGICSDGFYSTDIFSVDSSGNSTVGVPGGIVSDVVERDTVRPDKPSAVVQANDTARSISLTLSGEGNSLARIGGSTTSVEYLNNAGTANTVVLYPSAWRYSTTYTWTITIEDRAGNVSETATVSYTTPAPPKLLSPCKAVTPGKISWPLTVSAPITSGFGNRTYNGVTSLHGGIDIGVGIGTDVIAAHNGVVTSVSIDSYGGKYIDITDSTNNLKTRYLHLSQFLVNEGTTLAQGQLLAESGNTGNSDGPHLHFETWRSGSRIDPLSILENCTPTGGGGTGGNIISTGISGAGAYNEIILADNDRDYPDVTTTDYFPNLTDEDVDVATLLGDIMRLLQNDATWLRAGCGLSDVGCITQNIIEIVKRLWSYISAMFNGMIEATKAYPGESISQLQTTLNDIWEALKNPWAAIQEVIQAVKDIWSSLTTLFNEPNLVMKLISKSISNFSNGSTIDRAYNFGYYTQTIKIEAGLTFLVGKGIVSVANYVKNTAAYAKTAGALFLRGKDLIGKTVLFGKARVAIVLTNVAGKAAIAGSQIRNILKSIDYLDLYRFRKVINAVVYFDDGIVEFYRILQFCAIKTGAAVLICEHLEVNMNKQKKHLNRIVQGKNEYLDKPNRSELTLSDEKIRSVIVDKAGTGRQVGKQGAALGEPDSREIIDFGEEIGIWKDPKDNYKPYKTNRGTVHYANDGAHLVPSNPNPIT
jgi:murein DD-endopeptidase MepM/ murein hydrolase activator NlpD